MEIWENIFYKEEQNNPKLVIHYEQFAIKGITQNEMRMYVWDWSQKLFLGLIPETSSGIDATKVLY